MELLTTYFKHWHDFFWRLAKKKCYGQFSKSTVKSFILTQTTKNFNKIYCMKWALCVGWQTIQHIKIRAVYCAMEQYTVLWEQYTDRQSILLHGAVYCSCTRLNWARIQYPFFCLNL